jgi:uncharacterized RDD family membrane protein YckC
MDGIEVDRAGTRFGPYTPEEFLAYRASGHIVASGHARIGPRGGFEPVPVVAARIEGQSPSAEAAIASLPDVAEDAHHGPVPAGAAELSAPAGFWRRAGAYAVDIGLVLVAWTVVSVGVSLAVIATASGVLAGAVDSSAVAQALALARTALLLVAWAFYCAWQESSPARATLGKRLMGLVVVDRDGGRLSLPHAFGRHAAALLNWLTLTVGWLLAALPPGKCALHDHVAGTRVVCDGTRAVSPWIGAAVALVVGLPLLLGQIVLRAGFIPPF